jgi:hypothetical protein
MNNTFCTMRQLGAVFGVSSHFIGRVLKEMGLRMPDGQPSCRAQEAGLVKLAEGSQPWIQFWLWHKKRTTALLEEAGFKVAEKRGMADNGDVSANICGDAVVSMAEDAASEGDL